MKKSLHLLLAVSLLSLLCTRTPAQSVQPPTGFPICPARPCILPADCKVIVQPDPNSDPCGCPTCGDPTPLPVDCSAVLCLRPPCTNPLPPPPGECCAFCPPACPPDCTLEYCRAAGNKKTLCSIPGPREIPGCTGQCQLTYCHACYFSEEARDLPGQCRTCGSPVSSLKCLRKWASCIHRSDIRENGKPDPSCITQEKFKCYRHPCDLRG